MKESIKEFLVVLCAISLILLPIALRYINEELNDIEQV